MLQQTDQQLIAWVASILGDVSVTLEPPEETREGSGVNLYLLDLLPMPPPSMQHVAPLQFSVRYLVSTWAETPEAAHQMLGDLALAAMTEEEMELDLEPITPAMWSALAVKPRPAFYLRLRVRQPRPDPETRLVRYPMVVQTGPAITLSGFVKGPEDIPIANARVEFPGLNRATMTDRRGGFTFATVPADMPVELLVKARGRVQRVTLAEAATATEPIIIELDLS